MALPSNIGFGTVVGAFVRAVADSPADNDRDPDGLPVTDLQVTFSTSLNPKIVRDAGSTPPVLIVIEDVIATVDGTGTLVGPDGQPGIRLVSTTDPDLQPTNWTWIVTFRSATFPPLSFAFTLDAGQTIDLASVVQVPTSPGATLDAWLKAVSDTTAARDAAIAARDTAVAAAASVPSAAQLAITYLQVRSSDPTSAERAAGVVAYLDRRLVPPVLKGWDGTGWVVLGGDPTPDNTLVTDTGDYLVTDIGDYLISA